MNSSLRGFVITLVAVGVILAGLFFSGVLSPAEEDPHAGHDHSAETPCSGGDGHDEESVAVELSSAQRTRLMKFVKPASGGTLQRTVQLPGKVLVDEDHVVHVVPPAGGLVRSVSVSAGQLISKGTTLAVLESGSLSEAKTAYLQAVNTHTISDRDLERATDIRKAATELLAAIKKSPTPETLTQLKLPAMDNAVQAVMTTYVARHFAQAEHTREAALLTQQITSQAEAQAAAGAYRTAVAEYTSARDALSYQSTRDVLTADQTRQTTALTVQVAQQHLLLLGVSKEDIGTLTQASQKGKLMGKYTLTAPLTGTIIARHLSLGEIVEPDTTVFTIADLSHVWVDLTIYLHDLASVSKGQSVAISLNQGTQTATGTISFISPVVDPETRTATARVILDNIQGQFKPGLFVRGKVDLGSQAVTVLIPRLAVQNIDGEEVVFLPKGKSFVTQRVELGRTDGKRIEILSGLTVGQRYLARDAFSLKAHILTSGMDPHAGHGH